MSNNGLIQKLFDLLLLVSIGSGIFVSSLVFANGEEDIQTRKNQTKAIVWSNPKLVNYNDENFFLCPLKLIIEEATQKNQTCFENVVIPYDFWAREKKIRLPIKVSLSFEINETSITPSETQTPTGEVITKLPLSNDSIKITLKETKEIELTNFIAKLDKEHRYYIEKAFPWKRHWLTYFFDHPKHSETCIKITIIHTGFIPLL